MARGGAPRANCPTRIGLGPHSGWLRRGCGWLVLVECLYSTSFELLGNQQTTLRALGSLQRHEADDRCFEARRLDGDDGLVGQPESLNQNREGRRLR